MNRIGGRFGLQAGQGLQVGQTPNTPAAKPQPQQPMPEPSVGGNRPPQGQMPIEAQPQPGRGHFAAISNLRQR